MPDQKTLPSYTTPLAPQDSFKSLPNILLISFDQRQHGLYVPALYLPQWVLGHNISILVAPLIGVPGRILMAT